MTSRIITLGLPAASAAYVMTRKNLNPQTKQMVLIGSAGVAVFLNADMLTSSIVSGVSASIDDLGKGLAAGIDSLAKGLLSTIGDISSEVVDTVGDLASDAFDSAKEVFTDTTSTITSWFQTQSELQKRPGSQSTPYSPYEKEAMLRSMYRILLHRKIDEVGFRYWLDKLNNWRYYKVAEKLESDSERKNIINDRGGTIYTIDEIEGWLAMINQILYHGNIKPEWRVWYIKRMKRYNQYKGKENRDSKAWMVLDQLDREDERPLRYAIIHDPTYLNFKPPVIGDQNTESADIEAKWKRLFNQLFSIFWNIPIQNGKEPIRQKNSKERLTGLVLSGAPLHEVISGEWLVTKGPNYDSWAMIDLRKAFYDAIFINLFPEKELTPQLMSEIDAKCSNYADCAYHLTAAWSRKTESLTDEQYQNQAF